jgi:hypothetical protein
MDDNIKAWLYDILNAIMEIEGFFSDRPKDFINYQMIYGRKGPLKEI